MTRDEMSRTVSAELEHIPDRPGEYQSELRMLYNMVRRRSLGPNSEGFASAADVLRYCIASIQQRHPGAELNFDHAYFGIGRETGVTA